MRLLVRRAELTLHAMDYTRRNIMKATHVVALFAALLLTATEFLVMDYDARQRAVQYEAQATSAVAARE